MGIKGILSSRVLGKSRGFDPIWWAHSTLSDIDFVAVAAEGTF